MITTANVFKKNVGIDEITITTSEFEFFRDYINSVNDFITIEEKFIILKENFSDLNLTCLEILNEYRIFNNDRLDLLEKRVKIIRSVLNFLTSAGMFLDNSKKNLSNFDKRNNSEIKKLFIKKTNVAYESLFGYRFCEAFKNTIKHYGAPITINLRGDISENYNLKIVIDQGRFDQDTEFKSDIKEEFNSTETTKKDLLILMSEYMNGLNILNKLVDSEYQKYLSEKEDEYNAILAKYKISSDIIYSVNAEGKSHIYNNEGNKVIERYKKKSLKPHLSGSHIMSMADYRTPLE